MHRTITFVIGMISITIAITWFLRPTFHGHGKDWWFERYVEDYTSESYSRNIPLSKQQEEAILAFHHFKEPGIKYLVKKTPGLLEMRARKNHFIYQILQSFPWNHHRDFHREKILRDEAALDLLDRIGIPFEWASKYGTDIVQSINHTNAPLLELLIWKASTNQISKLTNKVIPYLKHQDSFMAFKAIQILNRTNINALAAMPLLIDRHPMRHPDFHSLFSQLAEASPEARTRIQEWMENKDPLIAFLAALAGLNIPDEENKALAKISHFLTEALESPKGVRDPVYTAIRHLRKWPHPIKPLLPVLMNEAIKHEHAIVPITEILFDQKVDITPLVPKLENLLSQTNALSKPGFDYSNRTHAALYLLSEDFNNSIAWAYLDAVTSQLGKTIPLNSLPASFIQLTAPYSTNANNILKKHARASYQQEASYLATTRAYIRKYGLTSPKDSIMDLKTSGN